MWLVSLSIDLAIITGLSALIDLCSLHVQPVNPVHKMTNRLSSFNGYLFSPSMGLIGPIMKWSLLSFSYRWIFTLGCRRCHRLKLASWKISGDWGHAWNKCAEQKHWQSGCISTDTVSYLLVWWTRCLFRLQVSWLLCIESYCWAFREYVSRYHQFPRPVNSRRTLGNKMCSPLSV